jgi:hypothetical protein
MKYEPYKAQAPPRLLIDFIIIRTQMSKADIKQSIIKRGNCLWEGIDSVTWLQSPEAPHNFCDPSATKVCPSLPIGIERRLFKEYQELALVDPADFFPITSMRPALSIGSSDSFPSVGALPPSLRHLLCYWRVEFISPRRPLIIDGTLHPPQVVSLLHCMRPPPTSSSTSFAPGRDNVCGTGTRLRRRTAACSRTVACTR